MYTDDNLYSDGSAGQAGQETLNEMKYSAERNKLERSSPASATFLILLALPSDAHHVGLCSLLLRMEKETVFSNLHGTHSPNILRVATLPLSLSFPLALHLVQVLHSLIMIQTYFIYLPFCPSLPPPI